MNLSELVAVTANLSKLWSDADLRQASRRIKEWAPGVRAAAYDPDRTSPPNRVADINGARYVIPNISDPTGEAAIGTKPDIPDYRAIVNAYIDAARNLERVTKDLTRSADPSLFDLKATDTADKVRAGAGVCNACGRECTGLRVDGQPEDRIRYIDGESLCSTHYQGAKRNRYGDVHTYIASVRASRGLDLHEGTR